MKSIGDDSDDLDDSDEFWLHANEPSLSAIWDNPEDDIYAQLLDGDDSVRP